MWPDLTPMSLTVANYDRPQIIISTQVDNNSAFEIAGILSDRGPRSWSGPYWISHKIRSSATHRSIWMNVALENLEIVDGWCNETLEMIH